MLKGFSPSMTQLKRIELPGQNNAANGRTRSTRASRRSGTLPAFLDRGFQQLLN
jgi:hypothetical protein